MPRGEGTYSRVIRPMRKREFLLSILHGTLMRTDLHRQVHQIKSFFLMRLFFLLKCLSNLIFEAGADPSTHVVGAAPPNPHQQQYAWHPQNLFFTGVFALERPQRRSNLACPVGNRFPSLLSLGATKLVGFFRGNSAGFYVLASRLLFLERTDGSRE